jgi:hypothetical protein
MTVERRIQSQLTLARDGLDARNVLLQTAQLFHALGLPQAHLKAQAEELLGGLLLLVLQLVRAQVTNLVQFHLVFSSGPLSSGMPFIVSSATNLRRRGVHLHDFYFAAVVITTS